MVGWFVGESKINSKSEIDNVFIIHQISKNPFTLGSSGEA